MPFVGTTTGGGAWPSGGGTTVPNCNTTQQAAILAAINAVLAPAEIAGVRAFGGELNTLADRLAQKNIGTMNIDCLGSECTPDKMAYSVFGGNTTTFCPLSLPPRPQSVTNSTLFHELVHQCGGIELDAWALEEHFFTNRGYSRGNPPAARYCDSIGTGWPATADSRGLRVATFVIWNPATGEVFVKVVSGGSWPSSPSVNTGTRLIGPDPWWICNNL